MKTLPLTPAAWTPINCDDLKVGDMLEWNTSHGTVHSGVVTRVVPSHAYGPWVYFDGRNADAPREQEWLNNPHVRVRRRA